MKLDHSLAPDTKINSKWMKDLNVRQDSTKILEANTGNTLFELGHSNFLQDTSTKAKETKAKMNYWDFINLTRFFTKAALGFAQIRKTLATRDVGFHRRTSRPTISRPPTCSYSILSNQMAFAGRASQRVFLF